jgi:hypothetical protein
MAAFGFVSSDGKSFGSITNVCKFLDADVRQLLHNFLRLKLTQHRAFLRNLQIAAAFHIGRHYLVNWNVMTFNLWKSRYSGVISLGPHLNATVANVIKRSRANTKRDKAFEY